jgi:phage I-like protein
MRCQSVAFNSELVLADGVAPASVQLIPAGPRVNGFDGRAWIFDDLSHKAVLAGFGARGLDLPIDWEHATQHRAPKGQDAPAAAWITALNMRDGQLWADVAWTPRGAEQVADRSYRYLSPVFDYEVETGRIVLLVSAGLTNKPNLRLQALNQEEHAMNRSAALVAAITGALGLTADANDDAVAQAINSIKQDRDTAQAANRESAPSLDRYVPRADYDVLAQRATNAEQTLKAHKDGQHKVEVDAAIEGALKAGKITPATSEYHRATCADTEGLNRFRAFVGAAPVVVDDPGLDKRKAACPATALNAEQKEVCRLLGITESDFVAELAKE